MIYIDIEWYFNFKAILNEIDYLLYFLYIKLLKRLYSLLKYFVIYAINCQTAVPKFQSKRKDWF